MSYRLATLLDIESTWRIIIQYFTLTGTSFFWFFGLPIMFLLNSRYRLEYSHLWFVLIIMVPPIYLIKHTVKRVRPEFKDIRRGTTAFDEWSFPSGHASRATFLFILSITYFPNLWYLFLIWAFLIVLSRLLLGVHFISDIIAGIIITALLIWLLIQLGFLPYFEPLQDLVSDPID